jgi:TorA maturation chaperone TorD
MNVQNNDIEILLANRSYLYKLLQRIFGDEPNLGFLVIVTSSHTKESLELILEGGDNKFDTFYDLFANLAQLLQDDPKGTLDKLKSEHTALLVGPNKLPAPPWESVYRSKERLIFQESTLKVRQEYLKYNFLPAKYPHEADDHIALELDFMANLAEWAWERFEKGKHEEAKKLLADQKAFLENHLLFWIGDFAEQIQQSKTHYFYPPIALFMEQVLKIDRNLVEEIVTLL